jgi:hypothetical protein
MKGADEKLLCQRIKSILSCYPIWSGQLGRAGPELREQLSKTVGNLNAVTASPEARAVHGEIAALCRAIDERFPAPIVSHYLAATREAIARWDQRFPRHDRDQRPFAVSGGGKTESGATSGPLSAISASGSRAVV